MSLNNYILTLVDSFIKNDRETFIVDCRSLIKYQEQTKNFKFAKQLKSMINDIEEDVNGNRKTVAKNSLALKPIINGKVEGESLKDEILLKESDVSLGDVIINNDSKKIFNSLVTQWKSKEKMTKYNIRPQNKLLLFGPPGTGKTISAYALANALNLKIAYINFDALISSYLGGTSGNIGKVFKYAEENPCVLVIDEIDAIGIKRGEKNENGELKRVVISLLQNLDKLSDDTLLIGCTNHESSLDDALWRRFDKTVKFELPDLELRSTIISSRILKTGLSLTKSELQILSLVTQDLSPAIIIQVIENGIRNWVVNGELETPFHYIFDEVSSSYMLKMDINGKIELAIKLRDENKRKFTFDYLSYLLKVPKSTIHQKLRKDVKIDG